MSELPELISKHDVLIQQLLDVIREVETTRVDSGVVVLMRDGGLVLHSLGEANSAEAVLGLLMVGQSMAAQGADRTKVAEVFEAMARRSKQIAKEAPLWRPR